MTRHVFSSDVLQGYSKNKPDCFKRAARLVQKRCMRLDMDEESRVNAAISMTLCEVATAKHYSLPLECAPYSAALSCEEDISIGLSRSVQGECVDSLARSAQFWSSYSGYLRELPQLCHAFRRGNDIDLARNIYYNITVEKINLIRFMMEKERKSARDSDEWKRRGEDMHRLIVEAGSLSGVFQSTAEGLVNQLNDEFNGTFTKLRYWALELVAQRDEAEAQSLVEFENALGETLRQHSQQLDSLLLTMESAFASRLDDLIARQVATHNHFNSVSMEMERRWIDLDEHFTSVKQHMTLLSGQSIRMSDVLSLALVGAAEVRALQADAAGLAEGLADSLGGLIADAKRGLESINETMITIREDIYTSWYWDTRSWPSRIVVAWLGRAFGKILRVVFGWLAAGFAVDLNHLNITWLMTPGLGRSWCYWVSCGWCFERF